MITRTATIAGGSFSKLLETPEALDVDHLQYFDAADQIERRHCRPNIATFALANGQTTVSLAQSQNCKSLAGYARRTGNSDAAAGLCGSLQVGEIAAQFTANQPQFQQFLVKGRSEVIIRQGGNVDAIEDNCFMGSGGGVGGGAGRTIHREKVRDFVRAGLAVRSHHIRLGPAAHVGVRTDNAIQQNAAATVCTDLYQLLHEPLLSPLETRELTLVECPPCGNDEALRDYYTRTFAQAIASPAIREATTAQTVNGSNNLKAVSIVQPAWYERIPAVDIEKSAFAAYSPQIKRLQSPPTEVRPITLLPITTAAKKRDVVAEGDFLAMAESTAASLANLISLAAQSPLRYRVTAQVRVESGKVDLCRLDSFFNSFDASFPDFIARRNFVFGLLPEIDHHYRDWLRRKAALWRSLKVEIARLAFRLIWSFARGKWLSQLVSSAQLSRRKAQRLRKLFQAVRIKASELAQCAAVLRVLRKARMRLLAERRRIQKLLHEMDTALDAFEPFRPLRHPPVEMATLDEAWPVLSDLRPRCDSANRLALIRMARRVTAHGLQRILHARDFDAASLAQAVTTATPVEGPHWGNDGATRHYHTTYHVLPPLAGSLQTQIEECLFGTGVLVKFTTSCAGGVTAVRLRFSTPHDTSHGGLREIFTPQLRAAFKETISKSRREEHFPRGDEAWQWLAPHLGIRLPARSERLKDHAVISNGAPSPK